MADDPNATPNTTPATPPPESAQIPPPTPTPKQQPAPAPAPAPVPDSVKKQAAYFARKPDEFEAVLNEMGRATSAEAMGEVTALRRELTVRDALTANGLTLADTAFISGSTSDEINASAAALKARIGTPPANGEVPDATPEPEPQPAPAPAPDVVPALPENRGSRTSVEQSEAEFIEIFNKTDMSKFTE